MRFLILRVIVPLLLLLLARSLVRSLLAGFSSTGKAPRTASAPPVAAGGELKRDPVCGIYVSTTGSVTCTVKGQLLYFCSRECRDKYRAA